MIGGPDLGTALKLAYAVVVGELLAIALIRSRFMGGRLGKHHCPGRKGEPSCSRSVSGSDEAAQASPDYASGSAGVA